MILSTKTSTKFANTTKQTNLNNFIGEYKTVCKFFVDELWSLDKVPTLLPKDITSKANTWLSKRAIQCSAKQASGIVRGTKQKQKQRLYVYNKLLKDGCFRKAKKLKTFIDKAQTSKPNLNSIKPELDSRFVKADLSNKTSFDGWIKLSSLGNKLNLAIPFKKTKHFNKLLNDGGQLRSGVRISNKSLTFMFDLPDAPLKTEGKTIGLDVGIKNVYTTSDCQVSQDDKHGWNLTKIQQRLTRRKKNSKGFERAQAHRTNYINHSVNQLNFSGVNHLKLERIKNLRRGRRSSRLLSHWTYATLFDKLDRTCARLGVQVSRVSPTYTSQRCSQCGWVRKSNRKGRLFKCTSCGHTEDADLNASRNIVLKLPAIGRKQRLQHKNRVGFYWNVVSQECIVSDAQKA